MTQPDYRPEVERTSTMLPGGVRRRSPEELLRLAEEQGVQVPQRFEDLVGDWSEPDGHPPFDADAFIEARRQWQREARR